MHDTAELKKILFEHYKRYPCMQVQDMVKLIYQNEFAGVPGRQQGRKPCPPAGRVYVSG